MTIDPALVNEWHAVLSSQELKDKPVKTTQTKVYQIVTRDFDLDEKYDQKQQEINDLIFEQDIAILENQKPEQLPLDLQAELNHKSDRLSIEYRRWLKKLGVQFGTA